MQRQTSPLSVLGQLNMISSPVPTLLWPPTPTSVLPFLRPHCEGRIERVLNLESRTWTYLYPHSSAGTSTRATQRVHRGSVLSVAERDVGAAATWRAQQWLGSEDGAKGEEDVVL